MDWVLSSGTGQETKLRGVSSQLLDELVRGVDADVLLDGLSDGLKQEEPEDLEAALSNVEDALVVLSTLGATEAVSTLLDGSRDLLAWVPAELDFLTAHSRQRRSELGNDGAATELWTVVEESVAGAQLRQAPPSKVPSATLVDELLPAPSLLLRITGWGSRGTDLARTWVREQLAGLEVRRPVPVMGKQPVVEETWSVRGSRVEGESAWRAFVVDQEYPDGREITAELSAGGVDLWHLEKPGQTASVVMVAGPPPLPGHGLVELLDAIEDREDVIVVDRLLSRPN